MNELTILARTAIGAMLVANLPLTRMLGVCPLAAPLSVRSAATLSSAAALVMTISGIAAWIINSLILEPTQTTYLQMFVFVLISASLVQLLETAFDHFFPKMFHTLGTQLPLLAANCAVAAAGRGLRRADRQRQRIRARHRPPGVRSTGLACAG